MPSMAERARKQQLRERKEFEKKRKMGRPTYYDEERLEDVTNLALLGYTDQKIADTLGVSITAVDTWKRKHKDFAKAIKEGRDIADGKVVRSLYEQAIGYQVREERLFFDKKAGEVIAHDLTRHVPGNTIAAIFWLKNRQRAHWRDVKQSELSGPDGGPMSLEVIPVKQLAPADRAKLRAFLEAQITDVVDENEEARDEDGSGNASET